MESAGPLLVELAKQVPALAVLAFLTWKFLSHLSQRDETFATALRDIGDDCHEHAVDLTSRYIAVVNKNSDLVAKNSETLGEVKEALRHVNHGK